MLLLVSSTFVDHLLAPTSRTGHDAHEIEFREGRFLRIGVVRLRRVLCCLGAALAGCSSAADTVVQTTLAARTTPFVETDAVITSYGCELVVPSTVHPPDGVTTFMTFIPGTPSLRYSFAARPSTVWAWGTVHVTIGIHNSGQQTPRPAKLSPHRSPSLSMTDVNNKHL
jgi:hypothetical protein